MWNYRIVKTKENEVDVYKIAEVYYDNETGAIKGWAPTSYTTTLISEELEDLELTVEHLVAAIKKPVLLHVPEENDALVESDEN